MLCKELLQYVVNSDFSTYPEYLEWFVAILESLCCIPSGLQVVYNFSWEKKKVCFGILHDIDPYETKRNSFNEICFGFWALLNLKIMLHNWEVYVLIWMGLKDGSHESHKSPNNHFLHGSLLFCHRRSHCVWHILVNHGEIFCISII